jgi:hypothetical protein
MDFSEMMEKSRKRLLSENSQLKSTCDEKSKELAEEIKELESDSASLKRQREALGFFQFKKKNELDAVIEKYAKQIVALQKEKEQVKSETDFKIQANTKKLAIIDGKKGGIVEFGTAPYSYGREPLKWAIVSCDNQNMRLICMNTVAIFGYGRATKWLSEEFIKAAFNNAERMAVDAAVSVPTADESKVNGNRHVVPTAALKNHIVEEQEEQGRRCYYNSLQIQNGIKDELQRAEAYWLETSNTRDGFANYVGRDFDGGWICARIGAGAPFGGRPVINVDRFELTRE